MTKQDQDRLILAAKAAGYEYSPTMGTIHIDGRDKPWNPLDVDADAIWLMSHKWFPCHDIGVMIDRNMADQCQAMRLAIVEIAAHETRSAELNIWMTNGRMK